MPRVMFPTVLSRPSPLAVLLLALVPLLLLAGCSRTPESATGRPEGKGTATLTWTPPAPASTPGGPNAVAGYRIYLGSSPESLRPEAVVADPGATRYVVRKLPRGTHYFAVRSYDADGVESEATPVVSKTID